MLIDESKTEREREKKIEVREGKKWVVLFSTSQRFFESFKTSQKFIQKGGKKLWRKKKV